MQALVSDDNPKERIPRSFLVPSKKINDSSILIFRNRRIFFCFDAIVNGTQLRSSVWEQLAVFDGHNRFLNKELEYQK